jgi:hypothetical protein
MIQGAESEQYAHLRDYAEEIKRSNPNSTVIIKCGMSKIGPEHYVSPYYRYISNAIYLLVELI